MSLLKHLPKRLLLIMIVALSSSSFIQAGGAGSLIFSSSFESTSKADIVSVTTNGSSNNYTFNVGILSPDISCIQYADWWEVLDDAGLVHRRILGHSHAGEQPFVRSSGPVGITEDKTVWIRAHMNNGGYGGEMFTGSVSQGFVSTPYNNLWDDSVESEPPQVMNCAF